MAGDISALLDAISILRLELLPLEQRNKKLSNIQKFLVQRVKEYFSQERLKPVYDPSKTTWDAIHSLLEEAINSDKGGPVAEYLVGAKLTLKFTNIQIENHSFSSADASSDRPGDFYIGDATFHVTVQPTPGHFQRCKENLKQGLRPYLLVPESRLVGARQNAEIESPAKISVESIESFVSQNLDELSLFDKERLASGYTRLLQTYNQRVNAVENDKSLLIDIPKNLSRYIS